MGFESEKSFFRPWISQEQDMNCPNVWFKLDNRGKQIGEKNEKWYGIPLSSDREANSWRGYSTTSVVPEYISNKYEDGFKSQKIVCVYVKNEEIKNELSGIFPYKRFHIVIETTVNNNSVISKVVCAGLGNYTEKVVNFEDAIEAHAAHIFIEIDCLKKALDKPKYNDYRFYNIIGGCWKFKQTSVRPG